MMVKPIAPHPMVSISNQIGALITGPVFFDEDSKKFSSLIMRSFQVFGHEDHDVSVLSVFLVDMCVIEFNITIPHQISTVISHRMCLDRISRKSNRLRLKIVFKD